MEPLTRYGVAAIQTAFNTAFTRDDMMKNLDRAVELVGTAVNSYSMFGQPVKLVAFPEHFLAGVPYKDAMVAIRNGIYTTIPDGPEIQAFIAAARKYDIYIETGSLNELDPRYPNHLFNTACIVGPEGLVLRYRKVNPWIPGEIHTSPVQIQGYSEPLFPVADTAIGKLGVVICYDLMFPETTRQLAVNGCELYIRPSAWPLPLTTSGANWNKVYSQARSIENVMYGVHANLGTSFKEYKGYTFPGGTCIVDFEGNILSEIWESGEHILYGHVDLAGLRAWRKNAYANMTVAQIRTEAYDYLKAPIFPSYTHAADEPLTFDQNKRMTADGKNKIYG